MNTITQRLSITLLLCMAFTAAQAQRGPPVAALPEQIALQPVPPVADPLDAPTDHCDFNASPNDHVKLDYGQVAANRRLRRKAYPDTDIRSLTPSSQHWVTGCPVKLAQGILKTPVCNALDVFLPQNGNEPVLRIANSGNKLVFKIENTRRGLIKGELVRRTNPHGGPEEVWLESRGVTRNGVPESFIYYVFLRDDQSLKYYQVEVFDPSDSGCMTAHLPGVATLCMNAATAQKTCVKPRASPTQLPDSSTLSAAQKTAGPSGTGTALPRSAAQSGSASSPTSVSARQTEFSAYPGKKGNGWWKRLKQGDTGGGHEPPPVDN